MSAFIAHVFLYLTSEEMWIIIAINIATKLLGRHDEDRADDP